MFQGAWRGLEPEATPSPLEPLLLSNNEGYIKTLDRGSTRGASASRRGGDRFESRHKFAP